MSVIPKRYYSSIKKISHGNERYIPNIGDVCFTEKIVQYLVKK